MSLQMTVEAFMPEKRTLARASRDKRQGKSASTQAGEFVHEEMDHIREGKHGARSAKQAIAIGLSKARRAGVDLPPPKSGSSRTRKRAARDSAVSHGAPRRAKATAKRSRASKNALKRESRSAASHRALARQAHTAAKRRSASSRSASAKRAGRTKGAAGRSAAAKKAARTRAAHAH